MQQESSLAVKSFEASGGALYFPLERKEGAAPVERTPTGFRTVVHGYGTAEEVTLEIKREIDLEGNPYLEIELSGIDEQAKDKIKRQLEYGFIAAGYEEGNV